MGKFKSFGDFLHPKATLIKESIEPAAKDVITLDFGTDFLSGRYKLDNNRLTEIQAKLKQVSDFVKSHQDSDIVIHIISGESQVPNRDVDGPKDQNGAYVRLPTGALATNRANAMKEVVENFMSNLTTSGVMKGKHEVVIDKPVIGATPYALGEDPKQEKFTKEQFVKLTIGAAGNSAIQTANPPAADFSAYSKDGPVIYTTDKRALGRLFYNVRATQNITNPGEIHGQDLLLKTFTANSNQFDGNNYLITQDWWNKNVGDNYVTPELLNYIKTNFKK